MDLTDRFACCLFYMHEYATPMSVNFPDLYIIVGINELLKMNHDIVKMTIFRKI